MKLVRQGSLFEGDLGSRMCTHRRRGWYVEGVSIDDARRFIARHHSRAPRVQRGPWMWAHGVFGGNGEMYGAALWHNCSARGLPHDWRELRRMALSDDAPPNGGSFFLGAMARWFRRATVTPMLVSYQDVSVHHGTIYAAANWVPVHIARPRVRDRSGNRTGTARKYRTDDNGKGVASAPKVRWQLALRGQSLKRVPLEVVARVSQMEPTR
jgi:(2Fe-2S) ferredoxin